MFAYVPRVKIMGRLNKKQHFRSRLCFSCTKNENENLQDEPLRNAQASEIFRSAFLDGVRSDNRISADDIDDMIMSNRTRPSAILPFYHLAGLTLGTAARFSPQDCRQILEKAVQSATVQQFNDSIRNIQIDNNDDIGFSDTKETLKYHRDFEANQNDTSTASSTQFSDTNTAGEGTQTFGISGTGLTASTVLYHFLRLSRNL